MTLKLTRRVALTFAAALTFSTALVGAGQAQTTLSFLVDNADSSVAWAEQLVKDFEVINPDIKITIETRPGGTDGDNIIKTRLATGEMTDIFNYNDGSLFQAINPIKNITDLNDEPWEADVLGSFKSVVTATDGHVYGVPFGAAMGGGVLYNKKIYADLGLSVPKDWAAFMANSEKIKAAGKTGLIQSFADSWTRSYSCLATISTSRPPCRTLPRSTPPTSSNTRQPLRQCAASSMARKSSTPGSSMPTPRRQHSMMRCVNWPPARVLTTRC